MGIHDIPKTELIERASKELQKIDAIQPPQWALFAKTGASKQRQPSREDWWFVRAAAILRRLSAAKGPMGVQKLRTIYGGRKNVGAAPERFFRGSGNILRKIFQQLDKAGLTKKVEKGLRKGRTITPQGYSLLGKVADQYMKEKNIVLPKIPEGELNVIEPPKEKKPRVSRKRAVKTEAPVAEGTVVKRKRAPRKKKAEEAPKAEEKPAEKKEEKPAEAPKEKPAEEAPATEKKQSE